MNYIDIMYGEEKIVNMIKIPKDRKSINVLTKAINSTIKKNEIDYTKCKVFIYNENMECTHIGVIVFNMNFEKYPDPIKTIQSSTVYMDIDLGRIYFS